MGKKKKITFSQLSKNFDIVEEILTPQQPKQNRAQVVEDIRNYCSELMGKVSTWVNEVKVVEGNNKIAINFSNFNHYALSSDEAKLDIIEQGSHQELLDFNGHYTQLYRVQQLGLVYEESVV